MLKGSRLLRLYPRAWRERYGDELLEVIGDRPLSMQQAIDVVTGAVDAWLSPDVRRAVQANRRPHPSGGATMLKSLICADAGVRFSPRDSAIGAGVMLAWSALFAVLMVAVSRQGFDTAATILLPIGFPGAVVVSMPFTYLKGQPLKAQAVVVGGLLAILAGIAYLTTVMGATV